MAYESEMNESIESFYEGQGCNFCGGAGFAGREGVFEVLAVNEDIRKLVASRASGQEIRSQAIADGMVPLRRAGMIKASEGTTTAREVMRKVFFIE